MACVKPIIFQESSQADKGKTPVVNHMTKAGGISARSVGSLTLFESWLRERMRGKVPSTEGWLSVALNSTKKIC